MKTNFGVPILTVLALLFFSINTRAQQLTLTASDFNGFNISCFGGNNGSIDMTITGGTPPFVISWSNSETTEDISNLPAGYYRVTVDDADTLTPPSEAEITLIEPRRIDVSYQAYQFPNGFNISVFGACNGSIDISVTDGVSPYTYSWKDGPTTQDRSLVCASTYKVTVTDLNGCIAFSENIIMKEPERGDWQLTGNSSIDANTQYLGSIDNSDLIFKTNGAERARIKSDGEFVIDRLKSGRIVSPDSLIYFGDSTIIMHPSLNRLYGDDTSPGWKGTAIGRYANAAGLYSSSIGYKTSSSNPYSVAIGFRAQATEDYAIVIGNGLSTSPNTNLTNNYTNTIMMGCNSTVPTLFISSANGGTSTGDVGIGTTDIPNGYKLAVNGKIITTELKVQLKNLWPPDYVFEKDYKLLSIAELKQFIETHKHLPEIPSGKIMLDEGINTSEMLMGLLKKVEELTLYIIQLQSEIESLKVK
jgi:hypothetical protein